MAANSGAKRGMLTSNDAVKTRIYLVAFVLGGLFIYVALRLYNVQVVRHEELYKEAKKQYTAQRTKTGKRGEIRDIDGNLLIGNVPVTRIIADPCNIETELQARRLAMLLNWDFGLNYAECYKDLTKKTRLKKLSDGREIEVERRYTLLVREVEFKEAEMFRKKLEINDIPGVYFNHYYKRYYPKNHLLANVLGFIGWRGIEPTSAETTMPETVKEIYEVDRAGLRLHYGDGRQEEVRDGEHIYLTVSEPIQSILEEELDKVMEKWKPKTAYAIMADPRTGNIMAIAQRPTFNPNNRQKMDSNSWRLKAIEDTFEPGSVMKPMVVAGALDFGLVTPQTKFDCENGVWIYKNRSMRDTHPEKMLSVANIIKHSSNIGTAKIGLQLGEKRLDHILRSFGFGQNTGIPVKPETRGQYLPLNKWDGLSITRFPIGYGVGVSPVQILRAYCALADGGNLRKLRLIDHVEDPETGKIIVSPIEPPVRIYRNPQLANQIVSLMVTVTEPGGTATKAAIEGYDVAGKTGTSRKWQAAEKQYSYNKSFATFAGFVPAHDPDFALVVVVDEAVGSIYGGTVAAPAFREIASRTLKYLDIKPKHEPVAPEPAVSRTTEVKPQPHPRKVAAKPHVPKASPTKPVPEKNAKKFIPIDDSYYRRHYRQNPGNR